MTGVAPPTQTPASNGDPPGPAQQPSPWLRQAREFVGEIEKRCATDHGARAALRRGVGKSLDEVQSMHRIVAPKLPGTGLPNEDTQRAYYTVAALIADQRTSPAPPAAEAKRSGQAKAEPSPYGPSLGLAFAAAVARGGKDGMRESAAEVRLNLLTRQSVSGIHRHLPAAVRQLCAKSSPPDWAQLLVDLRGWRQQRGRTGRRWLQDFYRQRRKDDQDAARAAAETEDNTDTP